MLVRSFFPPIIFHMCHQPVRFHVFETRPLLSIDIQNATSSSDLPRLTSSGSSRLPCLEVLLQDDPHSVAQSLAIAAGGHTLLIHFFPLTAIVVHRYLVGIGDSSNCSMYAITSGITFQWYP